MLALAPEYIDSLCEVKSLTNDLLAVGRILKIDHEALELVANKEERLPLLQYRTPVKIFVHNSRMNMVVLVGIVYLSTNNFIRLEEVKPLQDFERRGAFRVNANVTGKLSPIFTDQQRAQLDQKLENASPEEAKEILKKIYLEVKLLDISLTGVRLQSPLALHKGEKYFLEFVPVRASLGFCLKVQRIIRPHSPTGQTPEIQYGCIFFDYTQRQLDILCRELFHMQRLEKSRRRNAAGSFE